MAARLPLMHKTPFILDGRPLIEATSPIAGALSILGLVAIVILFVDRFPPAPFLQVAANE